MRNKDLLAHFRALESFAKRDLPVKLGLRAATRLKKARAYFESVEEQRLKLLRDCAARDEHGKVIQGKDGRVQLADAARFETEWQEMLDAEAELVLGAPFTAQELEDTGMKFPTDELTALMSLGILEEPKED